MNLSGLSFDNIPPLRVPLGFFRLAPWFGVAAGLLLLTQGSSVLVSRWHPALLSVTHLLTLGFMAMIMIGALFQILPVISNRGLPQAQAIAPWIRAGLALGCAGLSSFFLLPKSYLLHGALLILLLTFAWFLAALGRALWRVERNHPSIVSLRLAGLALLLTVLLGGLQAVARLYPELGYSTQVTSLHLANGLFGWLLLLVMGVSFQVIPMFHVAPDFPRWASRMLPAATFCVLILLLLNSLPLVAPLNLAPLLFASLGLITLTYCAVAIRTLNRRKRKIPDVTVSFWHLGLGMLAASVLLGVGIALLAPNTVYAEKAQVAWGILVIYGFAISIIQGMLAKIVPFLLYLHLQQASLTSVEAFQKLPNMHELLPTRRSRIQLYLHALSLGLLLLSVAFPSLLSAAATLMVTEFAWLFLSINAARTRYLNCRHVIDQLTAPVAG